MDPRTRAAEHHQQALHQAVVNLAANPQFRVFITELRNMKDAAVWEACQSDPSSQAKALGAVRTYLDILALVEDQTGGSLPLD